MFQKTRIRLTIVNSLVFILLIGILGSIIYSYTYKRIYNEEGSIYKNDGSV